MPAPEPQVGEIIAGKYRVESVLGRGGMGVVFAARHTISERRVAVKWMEADLHDEPDALERFVREARAMGASSTRTSSVCSTWAPTPPSRTS